MGSALCFLRLRPVHFHICIRGTGAGFTQSRRLTTGCLHCAPWSITLLATLAGLGESRQCNSDMSKLAHRSWQAGTGWPETAWYRWLVRDAGRQENRGTDTRHLLTTEGPCNVRSDRTFRRIPISSPMFEECCPRGARQKSRNLRRHNGLRTGSHARTSAASP